MDSVSLLRQLRFILLITATVSLHGCGAGGTQDIVGNDRGTFVGSVGFNKKLSERGSYDFGYLGTAGNNNQFVSSGIQIDGTRFNDPAELRNRFSLHTLSANYRFHFYNGEILKLSVSPGAALSFAKLDSNSSTVNATFNEFHPGYGLKLGASVTLGKGISVQSEFGLYDLRAANTLQSGGLWLAYDTQENTRIKLGASFISLTDGQNSNRDGCFGTTETNNCRDTLYEINSAGVHIGVEYRK